MMPVFLKNMQQAALLDYFQESWAIYDGLFSAIKEDKSYYIAPDLLRHPLIFYYGHTAAFYIYINKMLMAGLLTKGINPHFEECYNLHMRYGSPSLVGSMGSANSLEFNDLFGNVWGSTPPPSSCCNSKDSPSIAYQLTGKKCSSSMWQT